MSIAQSKNGHNISTDVAGPLVNFGHSGALALSPERQSVRMSKIKYGGLDQYGVGPFGQQQSGTTGVEGVKLYVLEERKPVRCSY